MHVTDIPLLSEQELESDLSKPYARFINRELSWLSFNARVLSQAANHNIPLLERVKFLSIFSNNLDEFFMKRVTALKRRVAAEIHQDSFDGHSSTEQLERIYQVVTQLNQSASKIYQEQIVPNLKENGIRILKYSELNSIDRTYAEKFFREQAFPVLTPICVDSGHPFPFISNRSTSLGLAINVPNSEDMFFARVKVSELLPPLLQLPNGKHFLRMIDLIENNIDQIFPNMDIQECNAFRITRNADIEVDEEKTEDLRMLIEEEIRRRERGSIVRLEHLNQNNSWILNFLQNELKLDVQDIYSQPEILTYTDLDQIADLKVSELKFKTWHPITSPSLEANESIFDIIKNEDILLHHPYESFSSSVVRFVREAARDPDVTTIKMTVYRLGEKSPIIPLLIEAASEGKQVICMVELKARFDEARNIRWAEKLAAEGVHVVYGIPGLKIHAKTILVIRRENSKIRTYAHIGTGNYNSNTSELYTDFGLLTASPKITEELLHFFNFLTARSMKEDYQNIFVAPVNLRDLLKQQIAQESKNAQAGLPAQIIAKINGLEDPEIINCLYEASEQGVQIDLIVRGICCLRPGLPELSSNIRVYSILGRLLEHSRIFYFQNAHQEHPSIYVGSADWMERNLSRRVELVVPITNPTHQERVVSVLNSFLSEKTDRWQMDSKGSYFKDANQATQHSQAELMKIYKSNSIKH